MTQTHEERTSFRRLIQIGIALTAERDMDVLLDRILHEARMFTGAEAGSLYLVEEGRRLRFCVVQNEVLASEKLSHIGAPEYSEHSIAGYVARAGRSVNIADAYRLPADAPFEFDRWFDRMTGYRTRSVLATPMTNPDGEVLGVIQLLNAGGGQPFEASMEDLVYSLASQSAVAVENSRLRLELRDAYRETIFRLAKAAEFRDTDTGDHIQRVSHYAQAIAVGMGMSAPDAEDLLLAVSMHDVGKIAVRDSILNKPGSLDPDERAEIEKHAEYGSEILGGSDIPLLELSHAIAIGHHEKWDGSGYPHGLAGEDIPLGARICAIADVFDALTTRRVYKPAMSVDEACDLIARESGRHFDPGIVRVFFQVLPRLLRIKAEYPD